MQPQRRRDAEHAEKTRTRFLRLGVISALWALLFSFGCAKKEQTQADLILHHAKILTVDRDFSIQEAIAVKDGAILRVGSDRDVLKLKGPKTNVIDLAGRVVLPGLMDSHVHPG